MLKARLKVVSELMPSICKRGTGEAKNLQELGIQVADWSELKQSRLALLANNLHGGNLQLGSHAPLLQPQPALRQPTTGGGRASRQLHQNGEASNARSKPGKNPKAAGSGRTYTSRFRGVHQTFPTKRWEAQFRRSGKPTTLGCFDHEEEAARAYDKMMLWCEIHQASGLKSGITNFDGSAYEDEMAYLKQCTQDELIENLRSEGRKQAQWRSLAAKKGGGRD